MCDDDDNEDGGPKLIKTLRIYAVAHICSPDIVKLRGCSKITKKKLI